MKNLKHFVLAAAMSFACTGVALAADNTRTMRVSYSDLNTSSEAGSQTLLLRIKVASRQVCAPEPDGRDLAENRRYARCMKDSVRDAVAAVNLPKLDLAYEKSEGESVRGAAVAEIERASAPAR